MEKHKGTIALALLMVALFGWLKHDISGLRIEISDLRKDVSILGERVARVEGIVSDLSDRVSRIEGLLFRAGKTPASGLPLAAKGRD